MTFGIDVAVNVRITAGTFMCGVTFFGAGGSGNGCGVFMGVSENGKCFGFCFLAICARECFDTRFGFGGFFGNLTVIPSMTFCRDGFLLNEDDTADGAFFTVCQTCFGAGSIFTLDDGFGMTFGIDVAVNVRITAGAFMCGVSFFRTSGFRYEFCIFVRMFESGDGFRFCFSASTAGKDTDTRFGFRRFFCNLAFTPSMSR